jgi:hypothetical protein
MTGDPGGWKCDECRRFRLEERRGCPFTGAAARNGDKVVWARHGAATAQCPKTVLTGESFRQLELFAGWQMSPNADVSRWPAKDVDALHYLAECYREAVAHEQRQCRE